MQPWNNIQPLNNINNINPSEQTINRSMDHDRAQAHFYKEAFASALTATEAFKTQVQTFDEPRPWLASR